MIALQRPLFHLKAPYVDDQPLSGPIYTSLILDIETPSVKTLYGQLMIYMNLLFFHKRCISIFFDDSVFTWEYC